MRLFKAVSSCSSIFSVYLTSSITAWAISFAFSGVISLYSRILSFKLSLTVISFSFDRFPYESFYIHVNPS